ncbi:uncharacterized protein LOC143282363 isoform X2 [Babylonia areolata]|uniref:uncharacterized protein LOC143282363 isoform X2 n=1 Tax=Babylonia areolata TaxID=304850 RepID=UPI003FD3240E
MCLREAVDNVTQFDAAVFDLLEKVSGKNQIDGVTAVDRISFTASSSSRGEVVVKDSSAFVNILIICLPVRPAIQGGSNNVAKICARNTVTDRRAILVLDRADRGQVTHSPSLCRCTLRSTSTLIIRSLDVRLQDVTSHVCHTGTLLKVSSQNGTTRQLTCEGLSARYGRELLYEGRQEVILDLVLSAHAFPSAVWLKTFSSDGVNVSCEAIIPVVSVCLEDDDQIEDQQAGKGNSTTKEDSPAAEDEGRLSPFFTALTIGLAAGLAVVLLPVVAVLVWLWRRGWNLPCSRSPGAEAAGSRRGTEVDSSGYAPQCEGMRFCLRKQKERKKWEKRQERKKQRKKERQQERKADCRQQRSQMWSDGLEVMRPPRKRENLSALVRIMAQPPLFSPPPPDLEWWSGR